MDLKGCKITWLGERELSISGHVDEYADFSELGPVAQQSLRVNFANVVRVNSSGIRAWIQFILKHKIQLRLYECAPAVVDQFSMIPEFLGKNGFVESFYANYQCSACSFEEKKLFTYGKDYVAGSDQVLAPLSYTCPKCQGKVELDHSPEVYFAFLRLMQASRN